MPQAASGAALRLPVTALCSMAGSLTPCHNPAKKKTRPAAWRYDGLRQFFFDFPDEWHPVRRHSTGI